MFSFDFQLKGQTNKIRRAKGQTRSYNETPNHCDPHYSQFILRSLKAVCSGEKWKSSVETSLAKYLNVDKI